MQSSAGRADADSGTAETTIQLPAPRHIVGRSLTHLFESTLAPLAIFYGFLSLVGLRWGLLAALIWSYGAMARRARGGRRMPGVLLLGAGLLTVRTILALATGSVFVYFLQPTLGTFLVAGLFLLSTRSRQPLAERLAHDFCPLPEALLGNGRMKRLFFQISLLWALVYAVNGATTLGLLLSSSLGTFLLLRTATSSALTLGAIACSYLWFRSSMRQEGVVIRWATARP